MRATKTEAGEVVLEVGSPVGKYVLSRSGFAPPTGVYRGPARPAYRLELQPDPHLVAVRAGERGMVIGGIAAPLVVAVAAYWLALEHGGTRVLGNALWSALLANAIALLLGYLVGRFASFGPPRQTLELGATVVSDERDVGRLRAVLANPRALTIELVAARATLKLGVRTPEAALALADALRDALLDDEASAPDAAGSTDRAR